MSRELQRYASLPSTRDNVGNSLIKVGAGAGALWIVSAILPGPFLLYLLLTVIAGFVVKSGTPDS